MTVPMSTGGFRHDDLHRAIISFGYSEAKEANAKEDTCKIFVTENHSVYLRVTVCDGRLSPTILPEFDSIQAHRLQRFELR